ncbi:MAG: hypothetical protein CMM58_01070 [Rhodospirillaceae bacterium]|nr:hypothetical protein [Rhodospirillaceae bacterium]|tara:strand:+ start:145 stop:1161 length:1017 start_codon:yes stop_codon:yes gene_type:complete
MEFWHFGVPSVTGVESMARHCEELGFDGLTLTDSQNLSNDTYIALTLAARATSTIKLGPGVTNPLTRHAAVTASAISSLQQVSDGRAVLGIGRGDSSLFNIGQKPVSPKVFRNYIEDLQIYLSGGTRDTAGYDSQLKWLAAAKIIKVPLDVAATGPKIIALGAEIAERVSFALGSDPDRIAWGMDRVFEAVERSSNSDKSIPSMGAYLNICVHDELTRAAELVRPGVGIFAHFTGMPGANRDNINQADQNIFDRLGGEYDKKRHGRAEATHAQQMPIEFIERFAIIGSAENCINKLEAIQNLGIQRIFVIGPRPDHFGQEAYIASERFANEVIPAFRN